MAAEHHVLLDSFAEARRTWDEMVALQPDIKVASASLQESDLVELERRVEAHRMAMDTLADALEVEPYDEPPDVEPSAVRKLAARRKSLS
jgi:hypothetical protein